MRRTGAFIAAASLSLLITLLTLTGCMTHICEQHIYLAKNPSKGEISLFRVTIEGSADMSETRYDAGWRNAEAMDELFKDIKATLGDSNAENYASISASQKKIIGDLCANLEKVASKTDDKSLRDAEDIRNQLIKYLALTRSLKASQTSMSPDAPAQKFMIVFSSDPNKIYAQLEQVVARQANEGALMKVFSSFMASGSKDDTQANYLWAQVEASVAPLTDTKKYEAAKKPVLDNYSTMIKDRKVKLDAAAKNFSSSSAAAVDAKKSYDEAEKKYHGPWAALQTNEDSKTDFANWQAAKSRHNKAAEQDRISASTAIEVRKTATDTWQKFNDGINQLAQDKIEKERAYATKICSIAKDAEINADEAKSKASDMGKEEDIAHAGLLSRHPEAITAIDLEEEWVDKELAAEDVKLKVITEQRDNDKQALDRANTDYDNAKKAYDSSLSDFKHLIEDMKACLVSYQTQLSDFMEVTK